MSELITILTPTYNRAKQLSKLYESLKKQSSLNFIWMIVDDGSNDDTSNYIKEIQSEAQLKIDYLRKENGGKHTALNLGIKKIETELTFIVDSDDYLVADAIESIEKEWHNIKGPEFCGISFLRGYSENENVGDLFPTENNASYIEMRLKKNVKGDKAEVFKTNYLKTIPFPEFENEKFIGEDYVWCQLSKYYIMAWRNKIIYICEYLDGGLSKSGRKLRINCPKGGMVNSEMMLSSEFPLFFRIKKAILYNCYYYFAKEKKSEENFKVLKAITKPFGYCLYLYWKYKYSK